MENIGKREKKQKKIKTWSHVLEARLDIDIQVQLKITPSEAICHPLFTFGRNFWLCLKIDAKLSI